MESALLTGLYNKRGVYVVKAGEGGFQEKQLAEQYNQYAEKCGLLFPKIAKVLRKLADSYSDYSEDKDQKEFGI